MTGSYNTKNTQMNKKRKREESIDSQTKMIALEYLDNDNISVSSTPYA